MTDGFEDIEALIPVDVLRRGGVDIQTVSITDSNIVESAHGVQMVTDLTFEEADLKDADLLMLPGGMPGATNLNAHEGLKKALVAQAEAGTTCYPGFEQTLDGATYTADLWTIDGNIITGEGPAAAFPYAYSLLALLVSEEKAAEVAEGMRYLHLMEARMM